MTDLVPVLTQVVTEVGQGEDPWYAADKRIEAELGEVHPRRPRRERDERTYHRQATRDEHRELAVLVEPPLGHLQVMGAHPYVAAIVEPQLPPTPQADKVGYPGADEVSDRK